MTFRSPRRNAGLVAGLMLALFAAPAAAQPLSRSGSSSHDHATVAQGGTTIAPKILSQLATSTATLLGRVTISTFTASSATISGARVTGAADLGSLTVRGQATTVGSHTVTGAALFGGAANFASSLYNLVGGNKFFYSNATARYIYSASDALYFGNAADTVVLMTILNGGNVGIGELSPGAKLHVSGNVYVQPTGGYLIMGNSTRILAGGLSIEGQPTAAGLEFGVSSDTPLVFYNNISERMRIAAGGNVGIRTTTPTTALSVYGVITSSTVLPTITCSAGTATFAPESTDQHGRFTNTAATYCDLTFSVAYPKTPSCFCNNESANMVVNAIPTTTTLRCNSGGGFGGHTISYMCMGAP